MRNSKNYITCMYMATNILLYKKGSVPYCNTRLLTEALLHVNKQKPIHSRQLYMQEHYLATIRTIRDL